MVLVVKSAYLVIVPTVLSFKLLNMYVFMGIKYRISVLVHSITLIKLWLLLKLYNDSKLTVFIEFDYKYYRIVTVFYTLIKYTCT